MDRASRAFFGASVSSSWFSSILGGEVDNARDSSWRPYFMVLLYLAAKPTHVRVDADELVYPLHHSMACGRQSRGQGLLRGTVLSCHCSGVVAPFRGM
jgi:hypothetical protein